MAPSSPSLWEIYGIVEKDDVLADKSKKTTTTQASNARDVRSITPDSSDNEGFELLEVNEIEVGTGLDDLPLTPNVVPDCVKEYLDLPVCRKLDWRTDSINNPIRKPLKDSTAVASAFQQTRGKETPDQCSNCKRGTGPWKSCVFLEAPNDSDRVAACANCRFTKRAHTCSVRDESDASVGALRPSGNTSENTVPVSSMTPMAASQSAETASNERVVSVENQDKNPKAIRDATAVRPSPSPTTTKRRNAMPSTSLGRANSAFPFVGADDEAYWSPDDDGSGNDSPTTALSRAREDPFLKALAAVQKRKATTSTITGTTGSPIQDIGSRVSKRTGKAISRSRSPRTPASAKHQSTLMQAGQSGESAIATVPNYTSARTGTTQSVGRKVSKFDGKVVAFPLGPEAINDLPTLKQAIQDMELQLCVIKRRIKHLHDAKAVSNPWDLV